MNEVCFCGWTGAIEDRSYIRTDDFREGLACPNCGHVDELEYLSALSRLDTLAIAKARSAAGHLSVAPLRLRQADSAA